jgi:hypothetical protein
MDQRTPAIPREHGRMSDISAEGASRPALAGRIGRWLLALTLAGAALAVGTVHTVTLCVVACALGAAAVLVWWRAEPMRLRPAATILLVSGVALTGYTALQCLPLPVAWLAAVAPYNSDVWTRALVPLHEAGPRWAPLSLDPVATRVETLKGVAYLLAFVTALRVARRREGVAFLSGAIVVTGVLLAAAAVLHPAFKTRHLFGVYEPGAEITDRHIAPLMNPNNLAGYLNVALCLALGATLTRQPRLPRAIMGSVVFLLGATQVWVASRGGIVTMVLGVVVVVVVVMLTRSTQDRGIGKLSLVSGAAAAVGLLLVVLGGSPEASDELLTTDTSKLESLAKMMRMLPAMPLFGCGRGAFESAFPAFRVDAGYITYTHPENVVAQWLLEWGTPVGIAGLVTVGFALRPTTLVSRSTTAAGAWASLIALFVQNLTDLGTEIPGLALAGVACAAIVVSGTHGREAKWKLAERWRRPVQVVFGASSVAAIALALTTMGHGLNDERRSLQDAGNDRRTTARRMHDLARAAMLRHPAEPYLPLVVASRASREHDDPPIPWIGATLERAPVYGPAHLLLARAVASRSPSQARLEYRLAMEQASFIGFPPDASGVVGGYFDAMELIPVGKLGSAIAEVLIDTVRDRLPSTVVRLDAELRARSPSTRGPALRAAIDAVHDIEEPDRAPWCRDAAGVSCTQLALDLSSRAQQIAPDGCEAYALHARARIASGDIDGGLSELEKAVDNVKSRAECLQELVRVARRAHSDRYALAALDKIVSAGCTESAECARNLRWVAQDEEQTGNIHKALALYRRAYEQSPDDDGLLEQIARLTAAAGMHAESAERYEQLARRHPNEGRWRQAATVERDAAMRGVVKL